MMDPVQDWLDRHGGPRRFEAGASADLFHLKIWLAHRGWELTTSSRHFCLRRLRGKKTLPRRVTAEGVFKLVDEIRLQEGLEPIRPMGAAA